MTTQKTVYTIERITVHNIDVPVVNHEKHGPMIAYTMLGEELGLSNRTFQNLIERKDMTTIKLIVNMEGATGKQRKTKDMAFIPLRKFEVLINSINTGHIGKTLVSKDRKALVEDIEALQSEIRQVIESYYHDGVAINKKKVPTKKGEVAILKAAVRHVSPEQYNGLRNRFFENTKLTKGIVSDTLNRAKEHLANSTRVAQKDRRTSHAKRLEEMRDIFEEGKELYADGSYKDANECFVEVLNMTIEASDASRSYLRTALNGLRTDVKFIKQEVVLLRADMSNLIKVVHNQQKYGMEW